MTSERHGLVIPDVDIWHRAFSRLEPDPQVVHEFATLARKRQIILLGWVRQTLLSRVRDERQYTRLVWVLGGWPDQPLRSRDHEQAADLGRRLRAVQTSIQPWNALVWVVANRVGAQVWSLDRSWHGLGHHGCPLIRR